MSVVDRIATQAVTFEDVLAAAERVKLLARRTPIFTSRLFNEAAGIQTYFKCENFQRGGAFKIRGALNFLLSLGEEERKRGVVTFSSGNHAQAVAIAASHLNIAATIVMPTDAPRAKLESTQAYGPQIVFYDRQRDDREQIARRIASETGAVTLPSYDHPWIIAGQGTAALEMMQDLPEVDAIAVPLGGGGLLSGTLITVKALRENVRVFGVEPELANDWYLSLRRGEPVEIPPPPTLADGLRTQTPGKVTFPIVRSMAEAVALVSEEEIQATIRFLLTRMKMLVEPSGAVAAAAVLHKKLPRD
ncbi:MAG: pyridoxal-phosphate dependent enzyme, partial [Acidobacteriaceae bacterium]|nr:pyridoxal-phosphate dependent enzyme [Acidobacteriaceae bacterium]